MQKHHEIPYKVKQMTFEDEWEAFVLMFDNQLGRRNLTDAQRTYILGKLHEARKMIQGTNNQYVQTKSEKGQSGAFHSERTRETIAREKGIGTNTVLRAARFVRGFDAAEEMSPGIKDAVLSGKIKVQKRNRCNSQHG